MLNTIFPLLTKLTSPGGQRGRLTILMYHRVVERTDPLFPYVPSATVFDRHMEAVAHGFHCLPLSEAIERLSKRSLPPRAACVTFDDGYRDNITVAAPILARHKIPGTIFVATGFLDGGRMWNDSVIEAIRCANGPAIDLTQLGLGKYILVDDESRTSTIHALIDKLKYLPFAERSEKVHALCDILGVSLPNDLMMSSSDVRLAHELNIEIGGHTKNHPILARLGDAEARAEIGDGKDQLESLLKEKITLFAYPNGRPDQDYHLRHAAMVKELGYRAACSTASGVADSTSDLFQLPRYAPWDTQKSKFQARLLQNLLRPAPNPAYA